MLIYYENIFQSLAFLCGVIALKYVRPSYLRWVILLLGITVVNELLVIRCILGEDSPWRDLAYNIFSFIDMGVWLYVFHRLHNGRSIRRWVLPMASVIYLYSFWEIYHKGWMTLHTDSFRVYELFILVLACSYLYSLLRKEYHVLTSDPLFWICAACIIYHAVLFLNFSTLSEYRYWRSKGAMEVFDVLQVIGNIFYYLFLSVAFITCISFKSNKTGSYPG